MSSQPSRLADYLAHIVQAIDRIQRYTDGMTAAGFAASEMAQDAVIRNLEVVGEPSRYILRDHPDVAAANPALPLAAAYEMRNALAHGYFKIDLGIVWNTLQHDLPGMRHQVQLLLRTLGRTDPMS